MMKVKVSNFSDCIVLSLMTEKHDHRVFELDLHPRQHIARTNNRTEFFLSGMNFTDFNLFLNIMLFLEKMKEL